jgi:hypothetical protein
MKLRKIALTVLLVVLAGSLAGAGDTPAEKRETTRKMAA